MKVLVTADWHTNLWLKGLERTDDILAAISTMVQKAVDDEIPVFIILGDLISPDSGKKYSHYLDLLMAKLKYLVNTGTRVIAIAGNHDVISWPSVKMPVTSLAPFRHIDVEVYEDISKFTIVNDNREKIECIAVPYLLSSYTKNTHGIYAQEYVDDKLANIKLIEGSCYVFSHLNINGAAPGQEVDMPRCGELFLPTFVEDCSNVKAIFNGHYHAPQVIRQKIIIPGSPERMDFGEEHDKKGFCIWEV